MKKILSLLILLLFTGCSATYEINLNASNIEEITSIHADKKVIEDSSEYHGYDTVDNTLIQEGYAYSLAKFEKDLKIDREFLEDDLHYSYQYFQKKKIEDYHKDSLVSECYDKIDIQYNDQLTIKTSDTFRCFEKYGYLEEVEVKINSDLEYVETNADIWGDGTYTWYISPSDTHKPINLVLNVKEKEKNTSLSLVLIFSTIIIIIGSIIYFLYKKNYRRGY